MTTTQPSRPWAYLSALCELQNIKYRIDGGAFHMGAGTIVLPGNTTLFGNGTTPPPPKLSPIVQAIRFGAIRARGTP